MTKGVNTPMRIAKSKNKKKERENRPVLTSADETEKVYSHQMMQMQSVFGNQAIMSMMRRLYGDQSGEGQLSNVAQEREKKMVVPEVVPISRTWDGESIGIRVYLRRNQFHYIGRSRFGSSEDKQREKKDQMNQDSDQNEREYEQEQLEKKQFTSYQKEERGERKSLFHPFGEKDRDEEKEQARKYYSSRTISDDGVEQFDEDESSIDKKMSNLLKFGRFTFLSAYPFIVKQLKRKKKEEEKKGKKRRKKSSFSRLKARFLHDKGGV